MNYEGKVKLEVITPNDGYNYFFGYYDLQPYDSKNQRHLTHRTTFADRLQNGSDLVEIGYIDLSDKTFHKIADSRTWNFQQGSLLQWFDDNSVIYNDFRSGKYCSVIKSLINGSERIIDMPLAHLSQDRKWGLSINFPRVFDFRPGYGYCNTVDEYASVNAPADDGIFLVDVEKNQSKLILSYDQLKALFPEKPFSDMKLVVNHITFNPSGDRFLFLLRNFPEEVGPWATMLITSDREGKDVRKLTNYEFNSHYHWRDDRVIMIYSGLPDRGIYFIDDATGGRIMLDDQLCNKGDIHCIYSPGRTCFIGDGYPDKERFRHLYLYDFESGKSAEILKIYSQPVCVTDIRCDLHNRFNIDGTEVSFDSYHSGRREIVRFNFNKAELLK